MFWKDLTRSSDYVYNPDWSVEPEGMPSFDCTASWVVCRWGIGDRRTPSFWMFPTATRTVLFRAFDAEQLSHCLMALGDWRAMVAFLELSKDHW